MDASQAIQAKIARFASFLQADPENRNLLLDLGDLYHQAGQFEEALRCFSQLASLEPAMTVAQSRLANVYLSLHRFDEAAALLAELVKGDAADAANGSLQYNLGLAQYYQGQYAAAAASFMAADHAGAASADLYKYLSHCLHHEGQLEEAVAAATQWRALTVDSDGSLAGKGADSTGYLALLEFDSGNREAALELAGAVLAVDPTNLDANAVMGGAALEQQDIPLAADCFQQILAQRPDYGRAWLGLGLTYLHDNNNDKALDAMTEATRQMPGHAGTEVALGWSRVIVGDGAGAEATFRKAIEMDRNFAESHGGLAVALIMQNRIEEAQKTIKAADRLDPANFGSVYGKALLLRMDGRSELAQGLINRALERAPVTGVNPLLENVRKFYLARTGKPWQ